MRTYVSAMFLFSSALIVFGFVDFFILHCDVKHLTNHITPTPPQSSSSSSLSYFLMQFASDEVVFVSNDSSVEKSSVDGWCCSKAISFQYQIFGYLVWLFDERVIKVLLKMDLDI